MIVMRRWYARFLFGASVLFALWLNGPAAPEFPAAAPRARGPRALPGLEHDRVWRAFCDLGRLRAPTAGALSSGRPPLLFGQVGQALGPATARNRPAAS
jgi:hypothetical protein